MVKKVGVSKYGIVKKTKVYPFAKWLRKSHTFIYRGEDYGISSRDIAQQIRNYVVDHGMTVSLKTKPNAVSITVWDRLNLKG